MEIFERNYILSKLKILDTQNTKYKYLIKDQFYGLIHDE